MARNYTWTRTRIYTRNYTWTRTRNYTRNYTWTRTNCTHGRPYARFGIFRAICTGHAHGHLRTDTSERAPPNGHGPAQLRTDTSEWSWPGPVRMTSYPSESAESREISRPGPHRSEISRGYTLVLYYSSCSKNGLCSSIHNDARIFLFKAIVQAANCLFAPTFL